jgi:peptidyl-tRNA hydrolase, PTH2 family
MNVQSDRLSLVKKAREYGIVAQYIRDAGRTQLAPNTATVAAVGPAPKTLLDLVTGHLKLY